MSRRRLYAAASPILFDSTACVEGIADYLDIFDLVSFSAVSKKLNQIVNTGCQSSWLHLIQKHFGVSSGAQANAAGFRSLAAYRIWDWDSVFSKRVYWARAGFTLSQVFEEEKLFGCSFCSSLAVSRECMKLDNAFEDWDDGHRITFAMPSAYYLSYEVSDHTMGTWRVGNIAQGCSYIVDRLDGHPVGPGFTFQEAKILIEFITKHCSISFDPSFLWPMFFFAIALSESLSSHLDEFMNNLKESGWKQLRLSKKQWSGIENYLKVRIQDNVKKNWSQKPRSWDNDADVCFLAMLQATGDREG